MNAHFLLKIFLCVLISCVNIVYAGKIYFLAPDFSAFFEGDTYVYYFGHIVNTNRDQCKKQFMTVKNALEALGHEVSQIWSLDGIDPDSSDYEYIVCMDVPINNIEIIKNYPKEKLILFVWEPPIIKPYNYDVTIHSYFSKVYTLLDDYVEAYGYGKFFESQPTFDFVGDEVSFNQRKLCTMLVGHRSSGGTNELYSKRKEFIDYCEAYAPQALEFYGPGWSTSYQTYKGFAPSKVETYKQYKFAICYENTKDLPGYITGEKIFFCFVAGCIPVYWGPSNVARYIPEECFIPAHQFATAHELYEHLSTMTEERYNQYIENIKRYLKSDQAFLFSNEKFADIVVSALYPQYDRTLAFSPEVCNKLACYKGWCTYW
jgi:alpha(1,3/1,4) fucosyltransferase